MTPRPCYVYFIQAGDGGPVKIGISRNVRLRLSKMQSDVPFKLRVLGAILGGETEEAAFHAELSAHKIRGEWFTNCAEVMALVNREIDTKGVEHSPKKELAPHLIIGRALVKSGISRPYASQIACGTRRPSLSLAIKIFRATGIKLAPIADATDAEIKILERIPARRCALTARAA